MGTNSGFVPNLCLGRVLFTHGPGIDQPLSAIRMGLLEDNGASVELWPTFVVIPLWNQRGQAPFVTFGDGTRNRCHTTIAGRCLKTYWLLAWDAYGARNNGAVLNSTEDDGVWMGGIMEDQHDATGLLYRRNRYYDPATGRFTQEDPIGLAGGLNLYGFAGGDPVSYRDPYGLCPYADDANGHRSADLADCPTETEEQRQVLSVYQAIDAHGGEAGDRAIAATVEGRLTISLRSRADVRRACKVAAVGCLRGRTIILGNDRSDGDLVYETVHEVAHSVNGTSIAAEVAGTIWGMEVYGGLPEGMRGGIWAGEYQAYSTMSSDAYRTRVSTQYCAAYRQRGMRTGNACN